MLPEILTVVFWDLNMFEKHILTAKLLTIDVVVFEIDLNIFYWDLAILNSIDTATGICPRHLMGMIM